MCPAADLAPSAFERRVQTVIHQGCKTEAVKRWQLVCYFISASGEWIVWWESLETSASVVGLERSSDTTAVAQGYTVRLILQP